MNIAQYLPLRAHRTPHQKAIYFQKDKTSYSYLELEEESNRLALGLKKIGVNKGDRIVLMVKPGFEFVALTFAIFKVEAVAVLIDPGIGMKHLKTCIKEVKPHGFIGIPKAHLLRLLWPSSFSTVKHFIFVGPKWFFGANTFHSLTYSSYLPNFHSPSIQPSDLAAIIFTTGSTGIPKGVVYEHGMFDAQVKLLKDHYHIQEGEVDMPTFPLFALFSVGMGTTCVIPDMDPTKPAFVDPKKIVSAIEKYGVTYSFGSPALWNRVTQFCVENKITLPTIRRILIAGAPVPPVLLERFKQILSEDAKVYTPYGATEALPITDGKLASSPSPRGRGLGGGGLCVGTPFPEVQIKIIRISDNVISHWDDMLVFPPNTIGEIVVKAPMVTKVYFNRPEQTALAKIKDNDGSFWHRMGDAGYLDENGNLWFCGRKSHRVITESQTLFTIPCESIFNQHKEVFRSALVGIDKKPIIIIEPHNKKILKDSAYKQKLRDELLIMARGHPHTQDIQTVLFHPSFPVDIRHNAKIGREALAVWAKKQL